MAARGADLAPEDGPWPGVGDPAELLGAIADWLGGYGNAATRRTYAEGLGLPTSAADLRGWLRTTDHPWTTAVTRYAAALGTTAHATAGTASGDARRTPPPAARGRFRHLHWFRWCAGHGIDPLAATSAHVKGWLAALDEAGAAVATRDRMLATVKALYTHLADTGLADGNPAGLDRRRLGLAKPKGTTTGTVVLTTGQVRALYETAAARRQGAGPKDTARAKAVVALFTLGLRVSELCDLDRADLHVTRGRRALRVHGKGGKTRVVYLHAAAEQALADYLRLTDEPGTAPATRGPRASRPLILTRTGGRYRRQTVWQLLRRLATAAGEPLRDVAGAMHPHALRHFYVTTAVEAGAQLVHVQADVGHTSIDTTEQVYNSAARDPARSAVDLVADALHLDGRDVGGDVGHDARQTGAGDGMIGANPWEVVGEH
ncbi:MAG: tyrosine-type recombinase/integrase [Actinophytocola sp.]|uniref:tyrosine-type recombinase/integrase n=1 Tax=Actinophytocola sp. TaxID=1872138 RepID=UPI0013269920|nr:tyrosine-type recombinase/integrase [Actinophytocola sp.]MPZ86052.1 tyrosine-type recombinase/integrase [Actinophytocola sp.]